MGYGCSRGMGVPGGWVFQGMGVPGGWVFQGDGCSWGMSVLRVGRLGEWEFHYLYTADAAAVCLTVTRLCSVQNTATYAATAYLILLNMMLLK